MSGNSENTIVNLRESVCERERIRVFCGAPEELYVSLTLQSSPVARTFRCTAPESLSKARRTCRQERAKSNARKTHSHSPLDQAKDIAGLYGLRLVVPEGETHAARSVRHATLPYRRPVLYLMRRAYSGTNLTDFSVVNPKRRPTPV